jgi:hypothetical protein
MLFGSSLDKLRLQVVLVPTNAVNPELEYHFQLAPVQDYHQFGVVLEPLRRETEALKLVETTEG